MGMKVEIDQSGKIGDTKVPTVLAFSNGKQVAILIPATVKRECVQQMRGKRKMETRLYIQMFSVGLFLLLKNQLRSLTQITIDAEYPGHELKIKEHLINLFRRAGIKVAPECIQFGNVGKKSNAHIVALATFKGDQLPSKTVNTDEIMKEFRKYRK
jgi:hypothetical protein